MFGIYTAYTVTVALTREPSLEVVPTTLAAFSSCDGEPRPTTLTFEHDP